MPKIIHAADFHLDSAFGGLPTEKARERRREWTTQSRSGRWTASSSSRRKICTFSGQCRRA